MRIKKIEIQRLLDRVPESVTVNVLEVLKYAENLPAARDLTVILAKSLGKIRIYSKDLRNACDDVMIIHGILECNDYEVENDTT